MDKNLVESINKMSVKEFIECMNITDDNDDVEYMFWLSDFVNDKLKIIESATGIKHGLFNTLVNKIVWIKKNIEEKKTPNKMVVGRLISELEKMNEYLSGIALSYTNEEIIEAKQRNNK